VSQRTVQQHDDKSRVRFVDRLLQQWRIAKAVPWIERGSHVLDVGCFDGALFRRAGDTVRSGVGIDVVRPGSWPGGPYELRVGEFPGAVVAGEVFDCVAMLAVVEHVPDDQLEHWSAVVPNLLRSKGRLIITTPSAIVDPLLDAGIRLRLLDGMETGQHHGFDPRAVPSIFESEQLRLRHRERFELGLNHLFVFERTS
jgi:hypothetical protein